MITTGAFPKQLIGNKMAYGNKMNYKKSSKKELAPEKISPRKKMAMKGLKKRGK